MKTSKYKNIFVKGYPPNLSIEVFIIKKVKNTVPWIYVLEEIFGTIYKRKLQKETQIEFRIEKVIKRKGYDNSFNSWIDEKDIVI